jgi:hypothetical protein
MRIMLSQVWETVAQRLLCAPINYGAAFEFSARRTGGNGGKTALLRTCRQILHEAQPVLYKHVGFTICLYGSDRDVDQRRPDFFKSHLSTRDTPFLAPLMRTVELEFGSVNRAALDPNRSAEKLFQMVKIFSILRSRLNISGVHVLYKDRGSRFLDGLIRTTRLATKRASENCAGVTMMAEILSDVLQHLESFQDQKRGG